MLSHLKLRPSFKFLTSTSFCFQTFKVDKNVSTRDDFENKVDQRVKVKRLKSKKKKSKKKKRRKDNQRKERKATQTLAIVLGENPSFYTSLTSDFPLNLDQQNTSCMTVISLRIG